MRQFVGLIPARYASTRYPGKMLVQIFGKSLIQRTYENAARCPLLNRLIVLTDDLRIRDEVHRFGGEVVMTSPHCATGSDRLAEALPQLGLREEDIVINVQGDEPCVPPEVTEAVGRLLDEQEHAVMGTAAFPIENEADRLEPSIVKCVVDRRGRALYFSRAPLPQAYGHIGIYSYRPSFLSQYPKLPSTPLQLAEDLEQLKVLEHGYSIAVALVNQPVIGVNTPEDLIRIERMLCQNSSLLPVV
jgi:3-deoxy-manno-octulosonate cytidylyltransferase (CMP-KDO synthetase)